MSRRQSVKDLLRPHTDTTVPGRHQHWPRERSSCETTMHNSAPTLVEISSLNASCGSSLAPRSPFEYPAASAAAVVITNSPAIQALATASRVRARTSPPTSPVSHLDEPCRSAAFIVRSGQHQMADIGTSYGRAQTTAALTTSGIRIRIAGRCQVVRRSASVLMRSSEERTVASHLVATWSAHQRPSAHRSAPSSPVYSRRVTSPSG